jgi:replicative DNA helicase
LASSFGPEAFHPRGDASRRAGQTGAASPGRVPPHDLDAEKAILSALLLDNTAIHTVYTEVKPSDFYHPVHASLYRAMVTIKDEGAPVDLHTLSDYLNRHKLLDQVGGPVGLAEIADYEATAANVQHHARIVRGAAVKRAVIRAATEVVEAGYESPDSADLLLDHAESKIFEISQETARETFRSLQEEMQSTFDYVEALMARGGELTGLALNMARNAAVLHAKRVAVFSLEMTARSLVLRLLASEAELDASKFRSGYISTHDHTKLARAASRLQEAELWIDDSGTITVLEMKAKCRRMKAERGLDLVIIDYLQLAHGDGRSERREQEISEISRGLKALAKELEIPVMALSQLNRGPENRTGRDKRPMLADLRESGAIEQDADVIAFIYRDEVYNRDDESVRGLAELIVAKQRNGPTGTVELTFQSRFARFLDRSGDDLPSAGGVGISGGREAAAERFLPTEPGDFDEEAPF